MYVCLVIELFMFLKRFDILNVKIYKIVLSKINFVKKIGLYFFGNKLWIKFNFILIVIYIK